MTNTIYDRYLEAEVLSADRVKLVWLLYRGALDAVRTAREHLAQGEIRKRAHEINRALGILRELSATLDPSAGAEISRQLAGLYAYMQGRLIDANVKQADEPLAEVISLLTTLAEGWESACQSVGSTRETPGAADRFAYSEDEPQSGERRLALALG